MTTLESIILTARDRAASDRVSMDGSKDGGEGRRTEGLKTDSLWMEGRLSKDRVKGRGRAHHPSLATISFIMRSKQIQPVLD